MSRLSRSLPITLYAQLADVLRQELDDGEWAPGDFFTTENKLMARFKVSRATVRRAIEVLLEEGRLERITGKGTFVAEPPVQIVLPHLISFSEEIKSRGMEPRTRVVGLTKVAVPRSVATGLHIDEGEEVTRLERVRYANGDPFVHMVDYLHPDTAIADTADFSGSLYDLLEVSGISITEAVHEISADLADAHKANLLGLKPGSPILEFVRISYRADGTPVVYEEAASPSERYKYTVRLTRKGGFR